MKNPLMPPQVSRILPLPARHARRIGKGGDGMSRGRFWGHSFASSRTYPPVTAAPIPPVAAGTLSSLWPGLTHGGPVYFARLGARHRILLASDRLATRRTRDKQTLKIRHFPGTSENAGRSQIAVAPIADLLPRLAHGTLGPQVSPLLFARLDQANLMQRRTLQSLLGGPEPPPRADRRQGALVWA